MDGEALHAAMNKARIAQSLPEDYLREILKRVEIDTPRTDTVSEPFMGTQSYQAMADHARELERELTKADERNRFLVNAYAKAHEEICQTAGKALGYPLLKDDQKNFPYATEADGVCVGEHVAQTIVEELAKKYEEANARIKRLEEACSLFQERSYFEAMNSWRKAKEAKP